MNKIKAIFLLLRLPFLSVTLGAVFLGTSFAVWETHRFNFFHFILALLGACFLHIACNVANDYFDYKSGNDAMNRNALVPFSGGSRMILGGFVKPADALAISIVFAILGAGAGLHLNSVLRGNVILLIGIFALFFVFNYNGFPIRLVDKGLGEVAIFLAWGPLMVAGAYYVQAGEFTSLAPLFIAYPSGILTMLVLLINEFADKEADFSVGRKTWVILVGFHKSLYLYLFFALSCYLLVILGVLIGGWPLWSLLVLMTLPLPFLAFKTGINNIDKWPRFLPAVKATLLMNFSFLVILSLSFLI